MKRGRFSVDEIEFIEQNCEALSSEDIADQLDRSVSSIKSWIETNIGFSIKQKKEIEAHQELKKKPYWKELEKQFSESELAMFQFHFKKMWAQFKDDVFHTEEIQILDTIKLEILMNRILTSQQENLEQIEGVQSLIQVEKQRDKEDQDRDYISSLERQISMSRAAHETLSKDYKDLQARKATMLKDLKGTREQRIKQIEDSKLTFASLVKKIASDPTFRGQIGIDMEKMRLATEAEKERLSEYLQYEDGQVDQPFLSDETVKGDLK
tara:strand:- start:702 stop:1502 length:801 start_codon:yes stop_codon:yes gene_type:complete